MRTNVNKISTPAPRTHEGAPADRITAVMELRRAVMACLLWEDQFYESGVDIAERIKNLTARLPADDVCAIAIEAREVANLRHVPLMLLASLLTPEGAKSTNIAPAITRVIKRADELAEIITIFAKVWGYQPKDVKRHLPAQLKKGVAAAFNKFDAYQLAKYDRNDAVIRLRDVAFMVHAKPKDTAQAKLLAKLVNKDYFPDTNKAGNIVIKKYLGLKNEKPGLETPDTWETNLSAGGDKAETFTRLLTEGKLGYLALLRNLRNMEQSGVDHTLVNTAIEARQNGADKVFPFRFIAAARAAKTFEPSLDKALQASVAEMPQMKGKTIILVDVSGSMNYPLSAKSDLKRQDAAAALATIFPGEHVMIYSFDTSVRQVPRRGGMGGIEAILRYGGGSTDIGKAVHTANALQPDRIIVITDEQSASPVGKPNAKHAYMINVASYKNGVGYKNGWNHIDGFSENVIRWIAETERAEAAETAPTWDTHMAYDKVVGGTHDATDRLTRSHGKVKVKKLSIAKVDAKINAMNKDKIVTGLKQATAFARGESSKARVTSGRSRPLAPELGKSSTKKPLVKLTPSVAAAASKKKKSVKKAVTGGKKTTKKSSRKVTVLKKVKAKKTVRRTTGKKTKRK